jgi:urease accessory protein
MYRPMFGAYGSALKKTCVTFVSRVAHDLNIKEKYGLASMMVAASLRLMRIHYLDAQRVLYEVNSLAEADYQRVAGLSLDEMAAFAPTYDIVACAHIQANVRMFMN